jgi:hypothetical protein
LLFCHSAAPARSNFSVLFSEEFFEVWEGDSSAAVHVSHFLLGRGLSLLHFEGVFNETLQEVVTVLPRNVSYKLAAKALLKALWRVVYYHIWLL